MKKSWMLFYFVPQHGFEPQGLQNHISRLWLSVSLQKQLGDNIQDSYAEGLIWYQEIHTSREGIHNLCRNFCFDSCVFLLVWTKQNLKCLYKKENKDKINMMSFLVYLCRYVVHMAWNTLVDTAFFRNVADFEKMATIEKGK